MFRSTRTRRGAFELAGPKPLDQFRMATLLREQRPQQRHRVAQQEVAPEVLKHRERPLTSEAAWSWQRLGPPRIDHSHRERRTVR